MIAGVQVTKATNDDLPNSFQLLDSEKDEARCTAAEIDSNANEVVTVSRPGGIEYRGVPIDVQPEVRVGGGQYLNVSILRRETLENAVKHPKECPQLTIRISGHAVRFSSLIPEQQRDAIARTFTESL